MAGKQAEPAAVRPIQSLACRSRQGSSSWTTIRRRVDRDTLWQFLSTEAYWGRWRTRSVVEQQLDSAWRVVGVYEQRTGTMVGFARAVSDGAGFAYLADVYIDKEFRGQGLGVELVATMIDRGPGASFRWTLHTSDAHGLYERFGFTQPDRTYLERPGTGPERGDAGPGTPGRPRPRAEVVALEHQAQPDQGQPRLVARR